MDVVERPPQLVARLRGDVSADVGQSIRDVYVRAREEVYEVVIFDFSGVRYINSEGVAIFFSLVRGMTEKSPKVVFAALTPNMRSVIKIVGLGDFVHLADDVDSWIGA